MKNYGLKISALNLRRLGGARRDGKGSYVGVARLGHIDRVKDGVIFGWIKDEDSDVPLTVDILLRGAPVGTALIADRHRQDVQSAGFGTGHHGFEFAIPDEHLKDMVGALIEVRRSSSGEILLRHVVTSPQRRAVQSSQSVSGDLDKPEGTPGDEPERNEGGVQAADPAPRPALLHPDCEAKIEVVTLSSLRGWAVDRAARGQVFPVEVMIDGRLFCTTRNDQPRGDLLKHNVSLGQGGVKLDLPFRYLEAGEHTVSLKLPDGKICSKTVVVSETMQAYPLNEGVARISPAEVAVLVPVYNAVDDVAVCIDRLARFTPPGTEILFIDDASPDPAIAGLMDRAERHSDMRVLRNAENLGFTRTINRGLAEIGQKHAILLNSDARVTPDWMEGMLKAASSRPRIATVTAMSDRAGAFSAPDIGNANELPPGVDEITYARAFRRRSLGIYPVVPTGNGFCMFVNRACIDEVGTLDAEAFPRGYGEENDFCMRAGRAGWTHLVDDCTYVFHDRSKSFGEAKSDLMAAGRAVGCALSRIQEGDRRLLDWCRSSVGAVPRPAGEGGLRRRPIRVAVGAVRCLDPDRRHAADQSGPDDRPG